MRKSIVGKLVAGSAVVLGLPTFAGMATDQHGNVGYDTAAECDAAVLSGKAKFYRPFTEHPALKRDGETDVKVIPLSALAAATGAAGRLGYDTTGYARGACDVGVGHSHDRDGVTAALIGKYVPYSPEMSVNAYMDAQNSIVRANMKQCDNNFSGNLPRPVSLPVQSECFATITYPAKFETRTEQVVKVPALTKYEIVPATYKEVSEKILATPEIRKQFPVPATYKTEYEDVVVQPAGVRLEPVPATYKTVKDQVVAKPESKRIEIIPATYKTVSEQITLTPARKEIKIIPAVYGEKEERIIDTPLTTRVVTTPATFKTVTEQVMTRPESVSYEPIALPLRTVKKRAVQSDASARLTANDTTLMTVTDRVVVKEASTQLIEVPAVFETITEQVKVAEASREWKRGRSWVAKALTVRQASSFKVDADGTVDGARVSPDAMNSKLADDDLLCLVEIPERYETITRQVLKSPATVRQVVTPAEYGTVTRQVADQSVGSHSIDIPATYQTVTYQEIDIDRLKTQGYKFDANGDIVATPSGERVLRAAAVAGNKGAKSAGAQSGAEGYVREIKTPADYSTVTRQVIDKPAAVNTIQTPATYKTVKHRVEVTPARTEEKEIPAVMKTVTRQVVDKAASTKEIVIPAVYSTVERRIVDTPATTREIPVPAVIKKVARKVIDVPASVREEVVPAVYKTVSRRVVDKPETTRPVEVPAQFETLSYQFKVQDATTERRAVLCDTNATPAKISEIQAALTKAGFSTGGAKGRINAATMTAINNYQQAKKLPVDSDRRSINLETIKSLGVTPF